ncbi:MAG: hypothetical protein QXM98_06790 [Thermoproteota archaeon]
MGYKNRFVEFLLFLTVSSLIISQAFPEKIVEMEPRVYRTESYIWFRRLTMMGDNLYVAGCSGVPGGYYCTLWKLDQQGNILSLWKSKEKGILVGVTTDGSTIFATGYFDYGASYYVGFIAAFDSECNMLWITKYEEPTRSCFENALVLGDYVYAAGWAYSNEIKGWNVLLAKYLKNGSQIWIKRLEKGKNQRCFDVTAHGNRLYLAGYTASSRLKKYDCLVLVTDEEGNEIAHYEWGDLENEWISGIAVGSDNNLLLVGLTESYGAGSADGLLLKMDPYSGRVFWWRTYGSTGYDRFCGIAVDDEFIHVVGGRLARPVYVRYTIDGTLIDSRTSYVGLGGFTAWWNVYSKNGLTYLVGSSWSSEDWSSHRTPACGIFMKLEIIHNLEVALPREDFWISMNGERKNGTRVIFEAPKGEYVLEAVPVIEEKGIRYVFNRWSDGDASNPRLIKLRGDISYTGIYHTEFYIEALTSYSTVNKLGWILSGSIATISIRETVVDHGNGTRRVFKGWYEQNSLITNEQNFSVIADRPRTIIADWDTEYEVRVKTDHGTASGSGWYLAGSTVTVSISTTLIEKDFFANYVFKGWVIDSEIISTSSTYSFIVTGPLNLTAKWEIEYNILRLSLMIGLLISIIIAIFLLLKRWEIRESA